MVLDWIAKNWMVSVYSCVLYLVLVYLGKKWMTERPAYRLRRPLILWNTGLALFSFMGMMSSVPNILG